jgi:hypothetical protein
MLKAYREASPFYYEMAGNVQFRFNFPPPVRLWKQIDPPTGI